MAIEISVSNNFLCTFVNSIGVFDCRSPGVRYRCPLLPLKTSV